MRATLRAVLLISAFGLSACSAIGETPSLQFSTVDGAMAYDKGRAHFFAGRYGLAIKELRQAVNADPGSIESLNALAAAYDRAGRFDLALHNYERALAIDPVSVQTLNNVGYSHYLQGRYDVAAVFLQDAVWLADGDPTVQRNFALVEQALDTTVTLPPDADTPQVGAAADDTPQPAQQIVRISRREQALIKTDAAFVPANATGRHPLLVALAPSPLTITPPPTSVPAAAKQQAMLPASPLTISPPASALVIAPPAQPALRSPERPDIVAASPAAPLVAKAFWIAGQPVPINGAPAHNSSYWPNSSYW